MVSAYMGGWPTTSLATYIFYWKCTCCVLNCYKLLSFLAAMLKGILNLSYVVCRLFQVAWGWKSEAGEEEVVTVFWRCPCNYLLRSNDRLRSSAGWRQDNCRSYTREQALSSNCRVSACHASVPSCRCRHGDVLLYSRHVTVTLYKFHVLIVM